MPPHKYWRKRFAKQVTVPLSKYGSKVGEGASIASFDLEIAKMTSCHLYQVKSFTPNFSAAGLPYDTAYHYGLKSGRKNVKARNEKSS